MLRVIILDCIPVELVLSGRKKINPAKQIVFLNRYNFVKSFSKLFANYYLSIADFEHIFLYMII